MSEPGRRLVDATLEDLEALVRRVVVEELAARSAAPASSPANGADWIDTKAAAAILGVCERNVQAMTKSRRDKPARLPATRVGRLLRFRRADVVALLERGSV